MLSIIVMLLAGTPVAEPAPTGEVIRFKARQALVSDSAGIPIFIGTRDFVMKIARNEAGTVVRYDAVANRVRVSTVGTELWLSCTELEPMVSACRRTAPKRRLRGAEQPADDAVLSSARVPPCPGDPRCPKID